MPETPPPGELFENHGKNGRCDGTGQKETLIFHQYIVDAVRNLGTSINMNTVEKRKNKKQKTSLIVAASMATVLMCVALLMWIISAMPGDGKAKDIETLATIAAVDNTEKDTVNEENSTEGAIDKKPAKDVELGDEVIFGQYNGAPIKWKVLKLSEDKTEAVLITADIITMKAFDAADSETFNKHEGEYYYSNHESKADTDLEFQAFVRGNSEWASSDIRAWLNGEKELVDYGDSAPTMNKMSDKKSGYDIEPGFLTNFNKAELAAIKTAVIKTNGNEISDEKVITTEDKVFLLSSEELELFEKASLNKLAKPTDECLEQDSSNWYEMEKEGYKSEMYYWWLRDPVEGYSSKCYLVGTEYWEGKIFEQSVGLEGYGIRPAITVDLTSDAIVTEE